MFIVGYRGGSGLRGALERMKRLVSIIAATAAVAAAVTIPADARRGASPSDELAAVASCLRAHGIAIPEDLERVAIKQWLAEQDDTAEFQAAMKACAPEPVREKASGPAPEELVSSLRDPGLNPPSNLEELKPWIARQMETAAGKDALEACNFGPAPAAKGEGCADDTAKPSRARAHVRARTF